MVKNIRFYVFSALGISLFFQHLCYTYQWGMYVPYSKAPSALTDFMQRTIHAMIDVNKYLFISSETYKIVLSSMPYYALGRIIDKPIQEYFYDKKNHRNIHQLAPVFTYSVDPLLYLSFATLIGLQFISQDAQAILASNTFLAVFPFLFFYKNILKTIPIQGSIRPKNQYFSPCKDYYGGFPSGHMLEISCAAYLFGSQLGLNYALPLSACALLVAVQSVVSNRHTFSQVIAGAALGCAFGAASKKVMSHTLHHERTYGIMVDRFGSLCFSFETSF